jgi:putative redox protein
MSRLKGVYDQTRSTLEDSPEQATVCFEATSQQVEGLRSEISLRQFTLNVDEPEALGGADTGPNPVELLLAALGSCQEITYRLYAEALGIPLDGVSVRLKGDLDLRGFFAVDPSVRPGYEAIEAVVELDSPADDADLERLKDVVDRHCPVLDIITKPTPVMLSLARRVKDAAGTPRE